MTQEQGQNWLVFGDDWGRHPSTTQHLVRQLLQDNSVYWIGSIGMRAPRLSGSDLARLFGKLMARARKPAAAAKRSVEQGPKLVRLLLLPWHANRWIRAINAWLLRRSLRHADAPVAFDVLLCSNPVAIAYADTIAHRRLAYLRLDDYARLPGVNPDWIARFEPQMVQRASCNLATAKGLLPGSDVDMYLPQGVDLKRFATVPLKPPERRCIGFFGLMESWLDYRLIDAVARQFPEWTFEFVGHAPAWPAGLNGIPNIRLLAAVDYQELPQAIKHWNGAWVPFAVNDLTRAVNPIKLREYLAAGLPALSTPLPESQALSPWAWIASDVEGFGQWLKQQVETDTAEQRARRRQEMQSHSWAARAQQMQNALSACPQQTK